MGCDYSKRTKAEPEDTLRHYESLSEFSSLGLADIDYAAIKYAPSTVLTEGQLRKIVEKLNLISGSVRITEFVDSLKSGDVYDREAFFVAAFLMAKGKKEEKCEYLMKLVVPLSQDTISRGQAMLLFELMAKASLQHTPRLTPAIELHSTAVSEYLSDLLRRKESFVSHLLAMTLSDRLSATTQEFTAALIAQDPAALTPTGVRKITADCKKHVSQPHQQVVITTATKLPKLVKKLRFSETAVNTSGGILGIEGQEHATPPRKSILKRLTIA